MDPARVKHSMVWNFFTPLESDNGGGAGTPPPPPATVSPLSLALGCYDVSIARSTHPMGSFPCFFAAYGTIHT